VTYSDIPRLLSMVLVWLVLLAWHFLAGHSGCLAVIALVALLTSLLTLSNAEIALAKRQAFIDACIEPRGSLGRLLRRRYLLVAAQAAKSLGLALFLLASAPTYVSRQWSLMFAMVLLAGLLLPRFYGAFAGQVRERYRYVTARRWTLWSTVLLLWIESLVVLGFSGGENFMGLRWQEVIGYAAREPGIRCTLLAQASSVLSAMDSLGLWSVQNLHRSLADLPQALAAGLGLLAAVALDFLRAYVFGLALIAAVARPWALWEAGRGEPALESAGDRARHGALGSSPPAPRPNSSPAVGPGSPGPGGSPG
jgi:hypothetical protein